MARFLFKTLEGRHTAVRFVSRIFSKQINLSARQGRHSRPYGRIGNSKRKRHAAAEAAGL
jgi:hypothetical protein